MIIEVGIEAKTKTKPKRVQWNVNWPVSYCKWTAFNSIHSFNPWRRALERLPKSKTLICLTRLFSSGFARASVERRWAKSWSFLSRRESPFRSTRTLINYEISLSPSGLSRFLHPTVCATNNPINNLLCQLPNYKTKFHSALKDFQLLLRVSSDSERQQFSSAHQHYWKFHRAGFHYCFNGFYGHDVSVVAAGKVRKAKKQNETTNSTSQEQTNESCNLF